MCATLGLLFPTIAFDINMGNNGVNTPLNTEVYCGTYLNTIAGMRAGGVVTCKMLKNSKNDYKEGRGLCRFLSLWK